MNAADWQVEAVRGEKESELRGRRIHGLLFDILERESPDGGYPEPKVGPGQFGRHPTQERREGDRTDDLICTGERVDVERKEGLRFQRLSTGDGFGLVWDEVPTIRIFETMNAQPVNNGVYNEISWENGSNRWMDRSGSASHLWRRSAVDVPGLARVRMPRRSVSATVGDRFEFETRHAEPVGPDENERTRCSRVRACYSRLFCTLHGHAPSPSKPTSTSRQVLPNSRILISAFQFQRVDMVLRIP
ncbi:hypothetical protein B0H11DRAFT_2435196 [Mycena galericulata]|nr:hypothetical protein B0H11DRAFT_2435196 [Mycena galericulata]